MPLSYDHLDVDLDVSLNVSNTVDIDDDIFLSPRDDSSKEVSRIAARPKVAFMLRFRSRSTVTERDCA
jgi:hypothetical protein